MRPLAVDLYAGLAGWSEGLIAAGFTVIGVDIEDMFAALGEPKPDHFHLILQDVRTLHGSQFKDAALIVGSSPCQEFSYRAMPWKRAKALGPPELGIELFNHQFRIQREASEAAGRHIPMIVENVRGARRWVGPSAYNYRSYYFWGDLPALMPIAGDDGIKVKSFRFDGQGSFQTASVRRTDVGNGAGFTSRDCGVEPRQGWFNDRPRTKGSLASSGSGSPERKRATAKISKIPFAVSSHIGRVYFPRSVEAA